MKKLTQTALHKSADALVAMTVQMIEAAQNEPSLSSEDLERLACAFSHALSALRSFDATARSKLSPSKAAKKKTNEETVCGKIVLPPVMERDAHE